MDETDGAPVNERPMLEAAARSIGEWPAPGLFEHLLTRWNPVDHDVNAFRLAVTLDIELAWKRNEAIACHRAGETDAVCVNYGGEPGETGGHLGRVGSYLHREDKAAAARLGIIKVAADLQIARERAAMRLAIQAAAAAEAQERAEPSDRLPKIKSPTPNPEAS